MSPKSNKSTSSESAPKKKKLTLAEGQAAAQANLASHSASLDAIVKTRLCFDEKRKERQPHGRRKD